MVLGALDPKNREIIEMLGLGISHKQIEELLYQIEAEWFPGALKPIFSMNLPYKRPNNRQPMQSFVCCIFPLYRLLVENIHTKTTVVGNVNTTTDGPRIYSRMLSDMFRYFVVGGGMI